MSKIPNPKPALSIIITHYNTPELLNLCLNSIKKTTRNIKKEIIVVDSESQEETRELIKEKHPTVKVIPFEKNAGYSKIVNAGIKKAKGDYILILNADIIVLEDSVSKMLKYIKSYSKTGITGPQLIDFTGNVQPSCFSFPSLGTILARRTFFGRTKTGKKLLEKFTNEESDVYTPKEVDWLQGSAMMIRKKAIKKVGLWDERFFAYFEDTDFCRRFWQNGYKVVYFPLARMAHYYHRSSKKWGGLKDLFLNKYTRIHLISALKYFWKYRKIGESKKSH